MDRIEELLNKALVLSQDMAKALTQQHYDVIKRLVLLEQEIEQVRANMPAEEEIDFGKSLLSDKVTASPIPPSDDILLDDPLDDGLPPSLEKPKSRKQEFVEKSKQTIAELPKDDLPF